MEDVSIQLEYELQELRDKQQKQAKMAIIIGIIFIITSVVFTILGIAMDRPIIFIGAIMQLFAGVILIISNSV